MANTDLSYEVYTLLKDGYEGNGGFKDGTYLVQHKRETQKNYQTRQSVAYYLNYVSPVVNSHVTPIFRRPPTRSWKGKSVATPSGVSPVAGDDIVTKKTPTSNSFWDAFVNDVDMVGTSIDQFMKRAALGAKLYGVCFIVVDNVSEPPKTQAQALKKRAFPYLYTITPDRVTKVMVDRYGRITSITYSEPADEEVDGTTTASNLQYRTWNMLEWYISDKDGQKLPGGQSGTHNLGVVPVAPLYAKIPTPGIVKPESEFLAIARTNLRIYNLCSELDEILRNQAFSILCYPGKEVPSLSIGVNNALGFDGVESRFAPSFIAPPSGPAEWLMKQIDRLVQEIYRMALLTHVTGVQEQRTGVSKAWDFEMTNQVLADFAVNCENTEMTIARIFALWINQELDYTCRYSTDFSIIDVESELATIKAGLDICPQGIAATELRKKAIALALRDIDPEKLKEVLLDLDTLGDAATGTNVPNTAQTPPVTDNGTGGG